MLMILIAIVVAGATAIAMIIHCNQTDNLPSGVFGAILAFCVGLSAIFYAAAGWDWFAAEYKTTIINREYHTNYTQSEVFWASDVIDAIRDLDRKRIELNGDIMGGEKNAIPEPQVIDIPAGQ